MKTTPTRVNLVRLALQATSAIPFPGNTQRALRGLARLLAPDELDAAVEIAASIHDPYCRALALVELARRQSGAAQERSAAAALEAIRQADDPSGRSLVLGRLADLAAPPERDAITAEALAAIRSIPDPGARADALAALPQTLLPEAWAEAQVLPAPWPRALALAQIAPGLSDAERTAAITEAVRLSEKLEQNEMRLLAWSALLPGLPAAERRASIERVLEEAAATHDGVTLTAVIENADEFSVEQLRIATDLARRIPAVTHRLAALAYLWPRLPEAAQAALSDECLIILERIEEDFDWSMGLETLIDRLPQAALPALLERARSLVDGWAQARALAALSSRYDAERRAALLDEAVAAALDEGNPFKRARALTAVIARL